MKIKIGKRNLKTAIAVFLSVFISKYIKLEYPFFAVLAAIFSMENSISSSYKAGAYRLLGTLIGAFVGTIFVFIQPGNAFLSGVGTLVLIFICNHFNLDRAVPIAGVVFASVMLSLNNRNPIQYSLDRVLATFIGILVAVIINYLIYPPDNIGQIRKTLEDITKKITAVLTEFICLHSNADFDNLQKEVIDAIKFIEAYKVEFNPKVGKNDEFFFLSRKLESLRSVLAHLRIIDELGDQYNLNEDNIKKLKKLNICNSNIINHFKLNPDVIYNYHISKILDILLNLD